MRVFRFFCSHVLVCIRSFISIRQSDSSETWQSVFSILILSDLICIVLSDCTWSCLDLSCLDLSWSDLYRSINWGSLSYPVLSYPILSFRVLCICSLLYLPIHPSINLSIYLSLLYLFPNYLTILLFVYLSIYPSIWYVSNLIHSLIWSYPIITCHLIPYCVSYYFIYLCLYISIFCLKLAEYWKTDVRLPTWTWSQYDSLDKGCVASIHGSSAKENVGVVGSLQYWHGRQKQNQNLPWELQYLGGLKFSSTSFYCL